MSERKVYKSLFFRSFNNQPRYKVDVDEELEGVKRMREASYERYLQTSKTLDPYLKRFRDGVMKQFTYYSSIGRPAVVDWERRLYLRSLTSHKVDIERVIKTMRKFNHAVPSSTLCYVHTTKTGDVNVTVFSIFDFKFFRINERNFIQNYKMRVEEFFRVKKGCKILDKPIPIEINIVNYRKGGIVKW